ncbi:hypothetical protein BT96DRAFT_925595 [Gymnopus androsaceus JB14]|uniref:Uncharacterized protein n=1 Tax=Gymnopus androsaceus JB14 TaxID=1447944 RepID=A0A6A4GZY9_9AGAR|nr:hypothetical protein BT96DRAFT_925595 [Gymnopus androsaceus JB14]
MRSHFKEFDRKLLAGQRPDSLHKRKIFLKVWKDTLQRSNIRVRKGAQVLEGLSKLQVEKLANVQAVVHNIHLAMKTRHAAMRATTSALTATTPSSSQSHPQSAASASFSVLPPDSSRPSPNWPAEASSPHFTADFGAGSSSSTFSSPVSQNAFSSADSRFAETWPATNIAGPSRFDVASVVSHLNALSFDASTSSGPSSGFYNPARTDVPAAFAPGPSRSADAVNKSHFSHPGCTSEVGSLDVMTPPQDFAHPTMPEAPQVQFPQGASHMSNVSSTNGSTSLWNQSAPVAATSLPAKRYPPPPYPPPWYPAGFVNAQSGYVGQYEGKHFAPGSMQSGNGYNGYAPAMASPHQGLDDQFEFEAICSQDQDWSETRFNRRGT